ncbi:MAG: thiolase family protein [Pseudomonadota bacterium]
MMSSNRQASAARQSRDHPVVLGSGVMPFNRYRDGSHWRDWVRRAAFDAIHDAGIEQKDIDAVVVASETDFCSLQVNPAPVVLDELGLAGVAAVRVEAGGASGAAALRTAVHQIRAGAAKCVLVVGFDAAAGHLRAEDVQLVYSMSFDAETDGLAGATAVTLYALSMAEHMGIHQTTAEQMAAVSVKNHGNAIGNPWAHKPMDITVQDVLASPMIAAPYHKLDCSMASDGAAAIVLAHADSAPEASEPRSRIIASTAATDRARLGDRAARHQFAAKRQAALAAYNEAGITDPASEIHVAEVYDAFTGAEIQGIEALGLAEPGKAGPALASGTFDRAGDLPVNLSGGLIGQGGAPGAVGIAQAATIDRVLTGRYRPDTTAARDYRLGLVDTHGGLCTTSIVHLMERVEP